MAKKVLQIIGSMNIGGAETFLMNLYRNIDKEKIQFDFVVHKNENAYEEEIKKLGGKIYKITSISKNPIKHIIELKDILKENKYEIIHRHTASAIIFIDLLTAKICGVKKIICHSHNSKVSKGKFLHKIIKVFLNKLSDIKLACSKEAGIHLYGKYSNFQIINNGIEISKFLFKKNIREERRKKYKLEDKFVISHIGSFKEQKNHKFLLEIFEELLKLNKNSVLILMGEGELKEKIKKQAKEKRLNEKVMFLGNIKDTYNILQATDIFLFPSLYEGLSVALVEAQISGLNCLISDTQSPSSKIADNLYTFSLKSSPRQWAEKIIKISKESKRKIDLEDEKIKEFDIKYIAKKMEKLYLD